MAIYTPYTTGFSTFKKKVFVKVIKTSKDDKCCAGREVITVSFLSIIVPVVIMFYALGVKSDIEMMQMIGIASNDYDMRELILSSIYKAKAEIKRLRRKNKALDYINEQLKKCKLSKVQDVDEAIKEYIFPNIVGYKQKAMFLGYMVNCLIVILFWSKTH